MVDGKTHGIIGIVIGAALAVINFYYTKYIFMSFIFLPLGYFFALLPDLDHKISTITWNFFAFSAIFLVWGFIFKDWGKIFSGMGIFLLSFLTPNLSKHRGVVHTVWFVIVAPLFLLFFDLRLVHYFGGVLCGWSHLIADGIPLKIK